MATSNQTRTRTPPDEASFGVFNVLFVFSNAGNDWFGRYLADYRRMLEVVGTDVEWATQRQRRRVPSYWDALTWIEQGEHSRETMGNHDIPELSFLHRIMDMLGRGRIDDRLLEDLAEHPRINNVNTMYRWFDARHPIRESQAAVRADLARFKRVAFGGGGGGGSLQLSKSGIYREFRVDMGDAGGSLEHVHWERLLVLALLVQIRADLEVFYETGHQRLSRCRHRDCQAWFVRRPMGQQQRFCSDVCRALSHRKQSRKKSSKAKEK